ncbi:MAG: phytochelatin synthase family protein [Myxococcota bacterium]
MDTSFHGRPLPEPLVDFQSPEGRRLLQEALADGTAEAFFPLVSHLHTQADPAWCGLGTLVTTLNALQIDPGRVWKGPWRFFGEELLVCCKSLELATAEGLSLAEVGCLAACNGAAVEVSLASEHDLAAFRRDLLASVRAPHGPFLVANYGRGVLGQTGDGHFSPLAAWHAASDQVLVLDVARFKYPPHWVPVALLYEAMCTRDSQTVPASPRDSGTPPAEPRTRGWLTLGRRTEPLHGPPPGAEALMDRLQAVGGAVCSPRQGR